MERPESTLGSLTPEQQLQLRKLQFFFNKFKERILQFEYAHTPYTINSKTKEVTLGKCIAKLPIVWDSILQDYTWLNRKVRRSTRG